MDDAPRPPKESSPAHGELFWAGAVCCSNCGEGVRCWTSMASLAASVILALLDAVPPPDEDENKSLNASLEVFGGAAAAAGLVDGVRGREGGGGVDEAARRLKTSGLVFVLGADEGF